MPGPIRWNAVAWQNFWSSQQFSVSRFSLRSCTLGSISGRQFNSMFKLQCILIASVRIFQFGWSWEVAGLLVCWETKRVTDRSGLLMNILFRRGMGVGTIMFYLVGESLFTYFGSLAYVPYWANKWSAVNNDRAKFWVQYILNAFCVTHV